MRLGILFILYGGGCFSERIPDSRSRSLSYLGLMKIVPLKNEHIVTIYRVALIFGKSKVRVPLESRTPEH